MYKNLPKFNELSYAHFVTTKTFENSPYFVDDKYCQILSNNIKFYQSKFDFKLIAWVIMPNHLHAIIWWDVEQKPELTISKIMHGIKWHSAKEISEYILGIEHGQGTRALPTQLIGKMQSRGKLGATLSGRSGATARLDWWGRLGATAQPKRLKIWKPKFYDFNIYSEKKFIEKINYIHNNPVRWGLVKKAEDYKFSSAKSYFKRYGSCFFD